DPRPLQLQFDKLIDLAGHATVDRWRQLLADQNWNGLVQDLLIHHYDPAYQRSIKRNFQRVVQAQRLPMASVEQADYEAAAASLSA
ncbi:MAG: tRNA 2-selenouridine(34) synthase MnmH, partial [Burkholderiaceae bacterium]